MAVLPESWRGYFEHQLGNFGDKTARMRIDTAEFRRLDLRVHTFLHDVPLHDVWAVKLSDGGPGRTMADVRAVFSLDHMLSANVVVKALFALRALLGRALGWDREPPDAAEISFVNRLDESDRQATLVAPGTVQGPFRVLYVFRREALGEALNSTVHAFSALALVGTEGGYMLYWAIYVRPVGRVTGWYMALIDPLRRLIVYPAILRHVQDEWRCRVGGPGA
ncbi:MAG: DUF2867 domain-containing protein [Candidatus Krumholzibacteriota bacterium]|nr:DUF2867 domain-containing protein [Candidatus Krumholzibacteriota bacterium]